ncbi:hypothetical protein LUZ63_012408 [Rhynchospora breviuscula]|uniref:Uncharacterized protein n=1 Tax=Rhynchospora breviuscula TaxID=2022672 RepID=A0A9Q0CKP7_9POAL|nr:hypothetical protein LUZ63_012408 [Rhynchospora breviuscula]
MNLLRLHRRRPSPGSRRDEDHVRIRITEDDERRERIITARNRMFTARSLEIEHSDKAENWIWIPQNDERFPEVLELLKVWWFDIKVRINFVLLSPETNYAAYLIFRTMAHSEGLDSFQEASVFSDGLRSKIVCIKPRVAISPNDGIGLPVERPDGWMELELGQFYCNQTTNREVVVCLKETNGNIKKSGLIVAGVEVRHI